MKSYHLIIEEILKKTVTGDVREAAENIKRTFGKRGEAALKAVRKGAVRLLTTLDGYNIWIVKGKRGNYLVDPGRYCSCRGFLMSILSETYKPCYHLIAQFYAEKYNLFIKVKSAKTLNELLLKLLP